MLKRGPLSPQMCVGAVVVGILVLLGSAVASEAQGVGGDRAALVALYNATRGGSWRNNTNWNSGRPLDEWYGVETDGAGRVTGLLLTGNRLGGEIPGELGGLTRLERLYLAVNDLGGGIPREFGRLTNLKTLDMYSSLLSGPIPDELGRLANLEVLKLDDNRLSGAVPGEIGNITNLKWFNMSRNVLTGPLPSSLTKLRRLEYLDIQQNAGLCAPADASFQEWLATVDGFVGRTCERISSAVPDAPTGLTVSAGDGALAASWTAPVNDGGSAIAGYKVQWRSSDEHWDPGAREAMSRTTAHDITGLTNGTRYGVRVAAVNREGAGAWSAEATSIPATPVPVLPAVAVGMLGLLLACLRLRILVAQDRRVPRSGVSE